MDEKSYRTIAHDTLGRVMSLFDDVDVDDADIDTSGDVITIRYRSGSRCVINTQSAVQQIWLAGAGRGWHFSWDETQKAWMDDRGAGDELFAILKKITQDEANLTL